MKLSKSLALMAALAVLFASAAGALAAGFTVMVEPVEVFNSAEAKELGPGIRSMVASRIAGQGYTVVTDQAAKAGAAMSLRTTITRLGGIFSVDAELTSATAGTDGTRAYETAPDVDGLMKAVEKVTERVRYRLWQVASASGGAPVEYNAQPPLERHPPKAEMPAPVAPVQPAPVERGKAINDALGVYREEARIDGEVTGLASADLEGDGRIEVVALHGKELTIYREGAKGLELVWQGDLDVGFKPVSLSVGDVDKDRAAEIFVAGGSGADVYTQAFVWRDKSLMPKGARVFGLIKAYDHPERGLQALGLVSAGGVDVFRPGFRVFTFTGSAWEAGAKVEMPDYVATPNVQWMKFTGTRTSLLVVDRERKIRIYGDSNEKLYVTEKPYFGTRARIEGESRDSRSSEAGDIWEFTPPAVAWDAPDGQRYAVVHVNVEPAYVSNRWGMYDNGSLAAIRWDGLAMHTGGESPKFQGFFAATARGAVNAEGRGRLYAALVRSEGTIFKSYKTTLISFDL